MTTNEVYLNRIEELENALEGLLDCFDTGITPENRPWIEAEVTVDEGMGDNTFITDGQVNQTTADAITYATEVLYHEVEEWGGCEE